ncbi:hypothetical protein EMIHUDRAFT_448141, partial [Emiliania huxleyi CCMP1516]|uniref:Guanylate cyclase domain-containing protein n=2 Tax=Emiliania huxleyi TaxID=2903 RepID=A0A0D3ITK8_EMIH1
MVAAGLPDPELLGSPQQRALGTCALAVAMVHVMDVVNAERPPGSAPLSVQIGVHSGSAIAGIIGHRKYQYDLVGDAVNTAARMCGMSAPGRVCLSKATFKHVRGQFDLTERPPLNVKGKGRRRQSLPSRRLSGRRRRWARTRNGTPLAKGCRRCSRRRLRPCRRSPTRGHTRGRGRGRGRGWRRRRRRGGVLSRPRRWRWWRRRPAAWDPLEAARLAPAPPRSSSPPSTTTPRRQGSASGTCSERRAGGSTPSLKDLFPYV